MKNRRAFSLIEVLVAIGIVGILAGLTAPAIERSREAARRVGCQSNLRNLTLAWIEFETNNGRYPRAWDGSQKPLYHNGIIYANYSGFYSPQCSLLPFLDQIPLYNSINFQSYIYDGVNIPAANKVPYTNATAASTLVDVFLCPDDPLNRLGRQGENNYRGNGGPCESCTKSNMGAFSFRSFLRQSDFIDGASNTICFSEKSVSDDVAYSPRRDWLAIPQEEGVRNTEWTPTYFVKRCSSISPSLIPEKVKPVLTSGRTWMTSGMQYTIFYTLTTPNSFIPDCGLEGNDNGAGAFAARSLHPYGVNASFCDGSVKFFFNSIDQGIWSSLGTRNGGEVIDSQ